MAKTIEDCDHCGNLGWVLTKESTRLQIQKCPECNRLTSDNQAVGHVCELATKQVLTEE